MTAHSKRIYIVAGEVSGDHHAASLIQDVKRSQPNVQFEGVGSEAMQAAGATIEFDCRSIAVVGLLEVFKILPMIIKLYRRIKRRFEQDPPDLLILVDYPGFNLKLAKLAKRYNIPVLYYISPQIWAWRQKRIHTIKRVVDQMAVIFPFETKLYEQAGVPVQFVGNPTVDAIQPDMNLAEARAYFEIPDNRRVIALLPGSRTNEIKRMLPVYLETARWLNQGHDALHFILPLAPSTDQQLIHEALASCPDLSVQIITEKRFDAVQMAHAAIVTSGTATLEIALLGVPLVLAYQVNWATYWFGRWVIQVPYIGLCNLVAQQEIAPELIQSSANPETIAAHINPLLNDPAFYRQRREAYRALRAKLPGVAENEAIGPLVAKMLQ